MAYNPFYNFTTYKAAKPEYTNLQLNLPLEDDPIDMSSYIDGFTETGTPIAKNARAIINNNEMYQPIQQTQEQTLQQTYKPNSNSKNNVKHALEFFVNKGLSYAQAAGVVGNLMWESGDPTLVKTDKLGDKNGMSYGIGQWNGSRRKNLENFAKNRGTKMSDLDTQLEFVWHEITDGDQKAFKVLEGLRTATDPAQAATIFMKRYERPGTPHLDKRIKYAKELLV